MALHGSLDEFSLPEVFCLVRSGRKSGILHVSSAAAHGSIFFREGAVLFARSEARVKPLGERLVDAGCISLDDLDRALTEQAAEPAGGRRLGEILVDAGRISPLVLESFVEGQIRETVFDLMSWDSGEFSFEVTSQVADEDIGITVSTENLIMEGSRRLEQWQRIRRKIPSTEVVFRLTSAAPAESVEIDLTPAEWSLLVRIDGVRSVGELARETGQTDFTVSKVLYGLLSARLIEAVDEGMTAPGTTGDDEAAQQPGLRRSGEPAPKPAPAERVPEPVGQVAGEPAPEQPSETIAEQPSFLEVEAAASMPGSVAPEPEAAWVEAEESRSVTGQELADLSGALGDELVALTGGGRVRATRSSRRSGDAEEKIAIRRDTSIDRAALTAIAARVEGL